MEKTRKKVLVVDDEENIRSSLELLLKKTFEVGLAANGVAALEQVDVFSPDIILLDVMMPELDGIETLRKMKDESLGVPVIMLTAANTVRTAVQAMKLGAVDFINKPFEIDELTDLILQTLERSPDDGGGDNRGFFRSPYQLQADFGNMVGRSPAMNSVFDNVKQVADRNTTVLITGESGTGKELIARRIHELSSCSEGPFVAINCAAIPETLIESELFGHEKGAFTHAVERRIGHFELADGGTLFLDEIGELSLPVQVKMLRFLQEHAFYPVGRSKPVQVDVRVIAATNTRLEELIKEKKFREDLYYRINVVNLRLPPLRDRFEDIEPLAEFFVKRFSPMYGDRELCFTESAKKVMREYPWPGNVRELENVVESLMALAPEDEVEEDHLPAKLKHRLGVDGFKTQVFEGKMNFEEAERIFETEMIEKALKKTNYVQTRAAELLGISRRILKYKMDKLGISDQPGQAAAKEPGSADSSENNADSAST